MGDVRDIIANGKKVIGGDGKATIPLIASIIGGVPGAGDIAKPIIKEVGEELTKKAIKETGGETVEKVVKEEVPQTIKQTGKLKIEAGRTLSSDEQEIANLLTAEGKNVKHFENHLPERFSIAWHGYLTGIAEWKVIDRDSYDELIKLLPKISEPDPIERILLGREY